jgi:hypothetical protein
MHPVLFYTIAVVVLAGTSSLALLWVNKLYSNQNVFLPNEIIKPKSDPNSYTLFTMPN